jgi:1-acyl-sn-glycerol-3-phosphate acyltransferase
LATLGREVASSYITLGALRASGGLASGAYRRVQGLAPTAAATPMQGAFNQAGMFGGIVLGHEAETRLGLRERVDGATTMVDSLAMLLQFNVAGRLLHSAAPGLATMTQEMHMRSEMGAQAPRSASREPGFGNGLGLELAPAGGAHLPTGERASSIFDNVSMMISDPAGPRSGSTPSAPPAEAISTPPPGSGPRSIPPGPRSGRAARLIKGFQNLAARFNWNATLDLSRPLTQAPIERTSPTPRSVREGMLRAEALGQNRRALAYLRWGASQLKGSPEVQSQFLNLMQRVFEFQARQREALDPVLQGLPVLDFQRIDGLAAEYAQTLERLTPGSGRHYAEARLLLERTREWQGEELFRDLSDARLREVGIEPDTVASIGRNAHAFEQAHLHRVLDHPLLRDRPETATIRQAIDRFHSELAQSLENVVGAKAEVARIRGEIAATEDVAQRQVFEQEIRGIASRLNIAYTKSRGRLNMAMDRYLGDTLRSRVFLVENARHAMLNRGLQDMNRSELVSQVRERLPQLEGELRTKAEELIQASEQMDLVEARGPLSRAYNSALRVFGFDPLPPLAVQGRYERAMLDVINHLPTELWNFKPLDRNAIDAAERSQSSYYTEAHQVTRELREGFRAIEGANNAFWERYDKEAVDLYAQDLSLQLNQAESQFNQLGQEYWRSMKLNFEGIDIVNDGQLQALRHSAGSHELQLQHGNRFNELKSAAEGAIQNFTNPATRGNNSRDANRSLEVALKRIAELRQFVRRSYDEVMIPGGDFRSVSALMLPFADKVDASSRHGARESFAAGWPILWRSFVRATALFSSLERRETTAVMDRHFLNWSSGIAKETGSSFVVDPNVRHLVAAEPVVAAGNHNSWLDFLQGGTPFARAAQLGSSASSRDAMRIGAKEGLGKLVGPVVERAIDLLTEQVADSAPQYDGSVTNLARAMAFGDVPGARPGPRSAAVYDELTMSVASLVNPFAYDPYPAISSILNPPQGGRSFNIADRAAALTGRSQNLLITSSLNAYRLWPKPDRPLPLRRGPTVSATQFLPSTALMDLSVDGKQAGTRANLLRTLWLNLGTMPEYQRGVPSIEQAFAPYDRPVDLSVETAIASRFRGIEELYPTAEGNRQLSAERNGLMEAVQASQGVAGQAETTTRLLRDLDLIDQVLESRTGQILRRRLTEIDMRINQDDFASPRHDESGGVRRLQRVVRARLKLLDQIDRKRERRQELSLTERTLLERMGATIAGRDDVAGRDTLIEQADYYFQLRDQGKDLRRNLQETQGTYYDFVRNWNERRRDPNAPEYSQLHVSEAEGYQAAWNDYRRAAETTLNVYNVTPPRWEGRIFPDMVFRREGDSTVVESRNWQPRSDFSRGALWRFLLDDTLGIVRVAKQLRQFDPSPDLYLTLHARAWGWRMLDRTHTRMRIENTDNARQIGNTPLVAAPTHDSGAEFMNVPSVLHDYGIRAFFMADRKFFDPFPTPPAFGAIRALLGPMDQYGHMAIDRSDRRAAMAVMGNAGRFIQDTGRSLIIFPGGTRNPVRFDENGTRYEGPIYGSKAGVGMTMEASHSPILPIGMVNGGVIFPKQNGEAFVRRGVAMGREYTFRFGQPIFYDTIVPNNPAPRGAELRSALVAEINQQFGSLTGRPVAEPAASKDRSRK